MKVKVINKPRKIVPRRPLINPAPAKRKGGAFGTRRTAPSKRGV